MFNICLGYGVKYYALATGFMFLPGILLLILQTNIDHRIDRRFGTFRANFGRLLITTLCM